MNIIGYAYGGFNNLVKFEQCSIVVYHCFRITNQNNPTLIDQYSKSAEVVAAAHAKGVPVELSLLSWGSTDPTNIATICADDTLLAQLVTNLTNKVNQLGADGVSIDWEAGEGGGMTTTLCDRLFIALRNALPSNKTISVYYGYYYAYEPQYIVSPSVAAATIDQIYIGSYYQWTEAELTSQVTNQWELWGGTTYPKSRMNPSIFLDGLDAGGNQKGTYADIIDEINPTASQDSASVTTIGGLTVTGGILYFQSITDALAKTQWLMDNGWGGIMLFCIDQDKLNDPRSMLQQVYDAVYPTQRKISIYITTGGITNPAPGSYSINDGETIVITAIPDPGYLFTSWSGDVAGTMNPITLLADADINLTANFEQSTAPSILDILIALLPMYPWEGLPLPRITALTWEKLVAT